MLNRHKVQRSPDSWPLLVRAIRETIQAQGGRLTRLPGRGRTNVWRLERNGAEQKVAFRTSQNRWTAFPPLEGGRKWKTLDGVELVFIAAVEDVENPQRIAVYEFPAKTVRAAFDAAYRARIKAGYTLRDNFGLWINLDADDRDTPLSAGSGLATQHRPIAVHAIEQLRKLHQADPENLQADDQDEADDRESAEGISIPEAKRRLAITFGVAPENVEITIRG